MQKLFIIISGIWLTLLLHLPLFNSGGDGFILPQNILTWMVVTCMCCSAIFSVNSLKICFPRTSMLLLISVFLMTLPVLWARSSDLIYESVQRFMGMWGGVFFYTCLLQMRFNERMRWYIIFFIVLSACIESLIVLQELFYPQTLDSVRSQFIEHNGRGALGTFQQVNVTASWIATGLASCLSLAYPLCIRRYPSDDSKSAKRNVFSLYGIFYSLAIILLTATLVLTQSRTGWLGGGLCCLILYVLIAKALRGGNSFNINGCLIIFAPLAGILTGLLMMNVTASQAMAQHAGSNHQRLLTLKITWEMIRIHPFTGWGIGSYRLAFQKYLASHFNPNPSRELMAHPHNELLYVWFEGGIVALTGIIVAMVAALRLLLCQKDGDGFLRWTILIPVMIHTQLEFPLYYSASHFIILLLIMAVLEPQKVFSSVLNKPGLSSTARCVLYSAATGFTCIILLWLGSILRLENTLSRFEENLLAEPQDIARMYIPPLSGLRYNHDMKTLHLINFYDNHQLKEIDEYIIDNERWLKLHPDPDDYNYQIEALNFLGHIKEAEVYRQHAVSLFPWDMRFR